MTLFGRILTGADVEEWCVELARKWAGTYLAEVERQRGIEAGALQRPRAFLRVPTFDKWPEDQLPAVLIVSVGLAEVPLRVGAGPFRARWQMGLGCICSARTQTESHAMAMLYTAALRALFVQRPSLEGRARGVVWQDETYEDQLEYDDTRSLSAGIAQFTVEVDDVVTANAGPVTPDQPLDPDTLPWPEDVDVQTTDVQIEREPLPTGGGR